jgi:hypothetical protein
MDFQECPWCRAGCGRKKDEEIIRQFNQALAMKDQTMFDDALDDHMHASYHRHCPPLQHADAMDAVGNGVERLLKWFLRNGGTTGRVLPDEDSVPPSDQPESVDGERIVGLLYALLGDYWVKGHRVPGEATKIKWTIAVKKQIEVSTATPYGGEESERTVGETIRDTGALPDEEMDHAQVLSARERVFHSAQQAVAVLERVVNEKPLGVLRETLDGLVSYARVCRAKEAVPIFLSAGIRYQNDKNKWVQMKRYRLGGWLAQLDGGKPLNGLAHIQDRAPSLGIMQWQIRPEVYVHFQTLPGWVSASML